jgi:hypothetical protein
VLKPEHVKWIDRAVYSPTQQFRIVGSRKIGSTRVKTFQTSWKYHDTYVHYKYPDEPDSPEFEFVMQLEASMISFTGNCKMLPAFDPKPETIKSYGESEDITKNDANEAINLIAMAGNIIVSDRRFPYKFMGINGPIVMLKRVKPSMCKICKRKHEHENPYLLVIGEEKNVYFFCRRASEDQKLFLGKLNPSTEEVIPEKLSPEQERVNQVKIDWTKNVLERVNQIARANTSENKKHITHETQIDPKYKNS